MLDISIIVCTRNRADSLARTLRSLEGDFSDVCREIIVVDNGSTDHSQRVLSEFESQTKLDFRHVFVSRPGQCHARNQGVAEARAPLIAFTDDDVVVRPGWADALVAGFTDAGVGAVGGRVIPVFAHPIPDWLNGPHLRTSALADYGDAPRTLSWEEDTLPFGANIAFRRDALATTAPFPPVLGHTGKVSMGWDEWHVLRRMAGSFALMYAPGAVVEHHADPARQGWRQVRRAHFQNGFGLARHERLMGYSDPDPVRRVIRAARAYRSATRIALRNRRFGNPSAEEAWEEFSSYQWAGKHIEALLTRSSALTTWAALHLA